MAGVSRLRNTADVYPLFYSTVRSLPNEVTPHCEMHINYALIAFLLFVKQMANALSLQLMSVCVSNVNIFMINL